MRMFRCIIIGTALSTIGTESSRPRRRGHERAQSMYVTAALSQTRVLREMENRHGSRHTKRKVSDLEKIIQDLNLPDHIAEKVSSNVEHLLRLRALTEGNNDYNTHEKFEDEIEDVISLAVENTGKWKFDLPRGEEVEALFTYKEGHPCYMTFCEGTIAGYRPDGKYIIKFQDGFKSPLWKPRDHIRRVPAKRKKEMRRTKHRRNHSLDVCRELTLQYQRMYKERKIERGVAEECLDILDENQKILRKKERICPEDVGKLMRKLPRVEEVDEHFDLEALVKELEDIGDESIEKDPRILDGDLSQQFKMSDLAVSDPDDEPIHAAADDPVTVHDKLLYEVEKDGDNGFRLRDPARDYRELVLRRLDDMEDQMTTMAQMMSGSQPATVTTTDPDDSDDGVAELIKKCEKLMPETME